MEVGDRVIKTDDRYDIFDDFISNPVLTIVEMNYEDGDDFAKLSNGVQEVVDKTFYILVDDAVALIKDKIEVLQNRLAELELLSFDDAKSYINSLKNINPRDTSNSGFDELLEFRDFIEPLGENISIYWTDDGIRMCRYPRNGMRRADLEKLKRMGYRLDCDDIYMN